MSNLTRAVCTTAACLELSSVFLGNLHANPTSIDACTNFEEYVCGGFAALHPLRPDQANVDPFGLINDAVNAKLRAILEGPYPIASNHSHFSPRNLEGRDDKSLDEQNFDMMQTVYKACMDEEAIKAAGIQPLKPFVNDLNATFDGGNFTDTLVYLAKNWGALATLSIWVRPGQDDPNKSAIYVSDSGTTLSDISYYANTTIFSEYVASLSLILENMYPGDQPPANASQMALTIATFEKELQEIALTAEELDDPAQSEIMTIDEAAGIIPDNFDLAGVINAMAPPDYMPTTVTLSNRRYFANLTTLLAETPVETLQSYFIWRWISLLQQVIIAPDVFGPFHDLQLKLAGRSRIRDRWRTCLSHTQVGVGWILSRFFIEGAFSARDRELGIEIIENIMNVYSETFDSLDWMTDEVKEEAKKKVASMVIKIGYPTEVCSSLCPPPSPPDVIPQTVEKNTDHQKQSPNITSPAALAAYYPIIPTSSYAANTIAYSRHDNTRMWSTLSQTTDRKQWSIYAHTVNAYYNLGLNDMGFPAAIMQSPVFHGDLPSAINYGAFGAIAGHEVSHGFDNYGRQYDSEGRERDWWTNATSDEYKRRETCFVQQFDNITVSTANGPALHIKGRQTLRENIADSAGLKASFAAWQQDLKSKGGKMETLKGFEGYTDEQLFFIGYGNIWCSLYTQAGLETQVLNGVHSPNPARMMGTLANSAAFKKAWGCKDTTPTCELW